MSSLCVSAHPRFLTREFQEPIWALTREKEYGIYKCYIYRLQPYTAHASLHHRHGYRTVVGTNGHMQWTARLLAQAHPNKYSSHTLNNEKKKAPEAECRTQLLT